MRSKLPRLLYSGATHAYGNWQKPIAAARQLRSHIRSLTKLNTLKITGIAPLINILEVGRRTLRITKIVSA